MKSIFVSKETLLKCIRLTPPSNAFSRNNLIGLTCITKVRLVLSHLCDHKFTHNFQGTPNPFCNDTSEVEMPTDDLLHCPTYRNEILNPLEQKIQVLPA